MLRYFRDLSLAGGFIWLLYAVVLYAGHWIAPAELHLDKIHNSPFAAYVFGMLNAWNTPLWVYQLSGWLLLLLVALWLNLLHNRYKLHDYGNRMTAAMTVLIAALFPEMSVLSPTLIVVLHLVAVLHLVFRLYFDEAARVTLLDIGMLLGMAILWWAPVIVLLPWVIISVILLRPPQIGDLLALLLGLLLPLFWVMVYGIWIDAPAYFLSAMWNDAGIVQSFYLPADVVSLTAFGLVALIVLGLVIRHLAGLPRYTIQVRKYSRILIGLLPFLLLVLVLQSPLYPGHLLLLVPPVALVLAMQFTQLVDVRVGRWLHLLLVGIIILRQYLTFVLETFSL